MQTDARTTGFLLMKRGLYYGPDNQGYTGVKERAGRYLASDARPDAGVTAVHEDDAPMFSPACWHEVKVEFLLARIAELETQGAHDGVIEAWQPIETAPKDGTIVDLWGEDLGRMTDCYWGRPSHECGEMGEYCDSDWHFETQESWVDGTFNERLSNTFITHWTLPPQPPALSPGKTVSAGEANPAPVDPPPPRA